MNNENTEENKEVNLDQMTVVELKAAAYDIFSQIQNLQATLQLVNRKIVEKNTPAS